MALVLPMSSATTSATLSENSDLPQPPKKKLRARRIMLTINQPEKYEQIKKNMLSRKCFRYLLAGREIAPGDTAHQHIHMYVEFTASIHITKPLCCDQHVDIPKTKEQAMDYCQKDCEVIDEIGQPSHQGAKTVKDLIETKNPLDLDIRWFRTWKEVKAWDLSFTKEEVYHPDVEIFFVWGECNVGKTKWVYDHIPTGARFDRIKREDGFWSGVSMNPAIKIAWYDEFRDSDMKPKEFINFVDYYVNNMNVKGGNIFNHYDTIYITSVQDPEELYPGMRDQEPRRQWMKRMKIIHLE